MTLKGPAATAGTAKRHPPRGLTLIELLVVLAIVTMLAAIALPNLVNARTKAQRQLCIENLTRIEIAKSRWAIEHAKSPEEEVSEDDLAAFFSNGQFPVCPGGGYYDIGTLNEPVLCSLDSQGHRYDSDTGEEMPGQGGGSGNEGGNGHGNGQGKGGGQGQGQGNGNGQAQGNGGGEGT